LVVEVTLFGDKRREVPTGVSTKFHSAACADSISILNKNPDQEDWKKNRKAREQYED